MKRKIALTCMLLMATLVATTGTTFAKSKGYHTAQDKRTEKSIVGIPVYTIGVSGQYYTNGKKVSKQSDATCLNSTHYPGWSVKEKDAKWTIKNAKKSQVKNTSIFFYGLDTQWITIGIQSYTDTISAYATP